MNNQKILPLMLLRLDTGSIFERSSLKERGKMIYDILKTPFANKHAL
jgi:hypothetical protein